MGCKAQCIQDDLAKTHETFFTVHGRSEHNPVSPQRAHPLRLLFALWDCILYGKYKLRLSPKFQEILRLPPKVTFGLIPASPNIAPAMKRHTPTLPEIHQIFPLPHK